MAAVIRSPAPGVFTLVRDDEARLCCHAGGAYYQGKQAGYCLTGDRGLARASGFEARLNLVETNTQNVAFLSIAVGLCEV